MNEITHIGVLVGIMIAGGLLGGFVNYLRVPSEVIESEKHPIWFRLLSALGASFAVPLFLNMISSSLLHESKSDPLKLFVFLGFCIIAGLSSRAFLDSLSKRVLNQVSDLSKEQKSLREDIEPVIEKEKEPSATFSERISLDEEAKKVLKALASPKWSMRTMSGVMKDTGLEDIRAAYSLSLLCESGLAKRNTKNGKDWWWLTSDGRAYIGQANTE